MSLLVALLPKAMLFDGTDALWTTVFSHAHERSVMPTTEEEIQDAIARVLDQTDTLSAREEALEELRSAGVLEDVLSDSDPDVDAADTDPADIEAELNIIKAELED